MKRLAMLAAAASFSVSAGIAAAQGLIDRGFVHGWNLMVDPAMGNGCLIQTIFEDLSVVRLGLDATNNRGYFVIFNKAWGNIEAGKQYNITFDLDGKKFDAVATGFYQGKVPGAGVFFTDRNFVYAIAQKKVLTVYGQDGNRVMAVDLTGSGKAIEYARKCQQEMG